MTAKNAKPNFSHTQVTEMVKRVYRLTPSEIRPLPSFGDQNFYVAPIEGGEYLLKIMNSEESKNRTLLKVQTYAMSILQQNGFPIQTVLLTTTGQLMTEEEIDCGFGLQKYVVRLFTYLPGTIIAKVPASTELLYEVGQMAAKIDQVLEKMEHPCLGVLQRGQLIWSLSNVLQLEEYIHVIDGNPFQEVVKSAIGLYKTLVVPEYSNFQKCINHGDLNDLNILVQPDESGQYRVSGILDFAEMVAGYYIHELATIIMYMMLGRPEPIKVAGPILAGWESVVPLNKAERSCLYILVLCHFCQCFVLAHHSVNNYPENEEYLMLTSRKGIKIFHHLWNLGKEEVEKVWFESASQFSGGK